MKKLLSILAVFVLCVFAVFGGVALAIGSDAALALLGIKGAPAEHAAEDGQGDAQDPAETDEDHAAGAPAAGDDKAGKMPVMPFPEIIVNVTDTSLEGRQSSRFLKLNMLLVFDDTQDGADRLVAREIYLRDSFQDFLRQLHVSDLRGSHGLVMLKTELLRRARAVGHTDAPVEILIADMVIQ
ncbi:flagellar motor switch protein M [Thalassococcus profundi]|uniref:Flagellar protein FliL n=1 Tax=Thalassococcus profundi TaxID=2282382 RepID=A0A369TL67_9RHOB|nr:flagellar basal body-associated FliL family protein [Thalassococcus profundi]RDD65414.1 flagellar motor switch protein M [Thalassococcus profundi]